jgi:hypothetical protein
LKTGCTDWPLIHLNFQRLFAQRGRKINFLGDNGGGWHGERDIFCAGAAFFQQFFYGVCDLFDIFNITVQHSAFWQRLGSIAIQTISLIARFGQLNQFDIERADIQAYQWRIFLPSKVARLKAKNIPS